MRSQIIFTLIMLLPVSVLAQADLGVKFTSINAHPFADTDLALHQNPLDKSGYLTMEPGIAADIYFPLLTNVRFGFELQAISDRFDGFTGALGINLSWMPVKYWKHRLFLGIGPKMYFYQNRNLPDNYEGDEGYTIDGGTGMKFMPLTGFVEYVYDINKQTRFCIGLAQTHPKSVGLSFGVRFILPCFNGKGCDCPSYR